METVEIVRVVCYIINSISSIILSGYFFREFIHKKLRASLAWGLGFLLFFFVMISAIFIATFEVTRFAMAFGFGTAVIVATLFYYGASLLFFREGSFFREKIAVIYFIVAISTGAALFLSIPNDIDLFNVVRGPGSVALIIAYAAVAILFYQVSRRLPADDPRRRTTMLVSLAWWLIVLWNVYLIFWLEVPIIVDGLLFLLGSAGFLLLLYGMTTGKTTR